MTRSAFAACVLFAACAAVACSDDSERALTVRVLDAVAGAEVADVMYRGSVFPAHGLAFGSLSAELSLAEGTHPVALVLAARDSQNAACHVSGPLPKTCPPPRLLASAKPTLAADSRYLIVFAERSGDERQPLALRLREGKASPAATSVELRFVHAMPALGSVAIEGGAGDPGRIGFRAATDYRPAPAKGPHAIRVRDGSGAVVLETSVELAAGSWSWTLVLIGDGSARAPFRIVPVPG